jgi:DNA polymerase I
MPVSESILDLDVFLASDMSQVEVRLLAELSGDPTLISYFKSKKDVHSLVGHDLTGWPIERIIKEKPIRKSVKELHFSIIFGKARSGIYEHVVSKIRAQAMKDRVKPDLTGVTKKFVESMYDKYFEKYPGVGRYIKKYRQMGENLGFVETLFKQRREIKQDDERGTFSGNQSINSPVQGSAHTFLLIALALLDLKPRTYSLLQRCIMEVHDALYFKVKLRELPAAYRQLKHLMEIGCYEYAQREFKLNLQVPLEAEASAGFSFASMIDYEGGPIEDFLRDWRKKQREVDALSWEDLMPQGADGI